MKKDASDLFEKAGLKPEDHPDVFERTAEILGEQMAFLSVAHACKSITGGEYIGRYNSQMESLLEELKQFAASLQLPIG